MIAPAPEVFEQSFATPLKQYTFLCLIPIIVALSLLLLLVAEGFLGHMSLQQGNPLVQKWCCLCRSGRGEAEYPPGAHWAFWVEKRGALLLQLQRLQPNILLTV